MEIICTALTNGVVYVSFDGTFKSGKAEQELTACLWAQYKIGHRLFVLWIQGRVWKRHPLKSILDDFEARHCVIHVVATDQWIFSQFKEEQINAYRSLVAAFDDFS